MALRILRSSETDAGICKLFQLKPNGLADKGLLSVPLSSPVNGFSRRPLSAVKIGASSMLLNTFVQNPCRPLLAAFSSSPTGKSNRPLRTKRCRRSNKDSPRPAVLLPTLVFAALYAYPFVEESLPLEREKQNVMRLPSQQVVNTALGCGFLVFLAVLFVAGGDDVVAVATGGSLVTPGPYLGRSAVAAVLVYMLCARTRRRHTASYSLTPLEDVVVQKETTDSSNEGVRTRCDWGGQV